MRKILKAPSNNLILLPTPSLITYSWNLGSLLGINLIIQILTGFLISFHYSNRITHAFKRYIIASRNIDIEFLFKLIHANGASIFFALIFIHIFRGLNNNSRKNKKTWFSGVVIFLIAIATAFLGYVLPWGQISLWGATVITNLISVTPYIGSTLLTWVWGGFSISQPTLSRFFSMHFIIPLIIILIAAIHIILLHEKGSSNNISLNPNLDKIIFKNFFIIKDSVSTIIFILILIWITLQASFFLIDPENFQPANPIITPIHIKPEWYFLFAYSILRRVPNKTGGILILLLRILRLIDLKF